jgi:prepilin peptidase CpaA
MLVIFLVAAVICDFNDRRIPNAITLFAAATGVLGHLYLSGSHGVGFALQGAALGLMLLLPFYLLGGMGAGDVKMMGAIGAFIGPQAAALATGVALICGGLMAVGLLLISLLGSRTSLGNGRSANAGEEVLYAPVVRQALKYRFPYALAIALGGLAGLCYLRF